MDQPNAPAQRPACSPGMHSSDTIAAIAGALAKAQGAYGEVKRDKHAVVTKEGKQGYEYDYADLASVLAAVRPALAANGIAVLQSTVIDGNWAVVTTRLAHSSGEWIESISEVPASTNSPQSIGSAITYARRYGLSSLCGVASERDDGGESAVQPRDDRRQQGARPRQQAQEPPRQNRSAPAPVQQAVPPASTAEEHAKKRLDVITWILTHQEPVGGTHTTVELHSLPDEQLRDVFRELKAKVAKAAQDQAIAKVQDQQPKGETEQPKPSREV